MEKEKVYLDSTIPSYIVSQLSRDFITLYRQEMSIMWWEKERKSYDLYISEVVLDEIKAGDLFYSQKRLELVRNLKVLEYKPEIKETAWKYMEYFNFSEKLFGDMYHIAYSVHYKMGCLLTWNFSHLANAQIRVRLEKYNEKLGFATPQIVTPEELREFNPWEDSEDEIY